MYDIIDTEKIEELAEISELLRREFPDVEIKDMSAIAKRPRITIEMDSKLEDQYLIILIRDGWADYSIFVNALNADERGNLRLEKLIARAREERTTI